MENVHDNSFVVYQRLDHSHAATPETRERALSVCSSYAEARQALQQFRQEAKDCVIRYEGISGGGD